MIAIQPRITPKKLQKEFYSDFVRSFAINPVKGDLVKLSNEDSVKQALENLILTNLGERFYHPDLGGNIMASIFDPMDELTLDRINTAIRQTISQHEPRVSQARVAIVDHSADNYLDIRIEFSIVNLPDQAFLLVITKRIR